MNIVDKPAFPIENPVENSVEVPLQPASQLGMVRIYVESDGIEVPMDFEPDEALDIANELRAAAEVAMATVAATGAATGTAAAPKSPETGHGKQSAGNGGRKPDTKPKSKPGIKQGGGGRGG